MKKLTAGIFGGILTVVAFGTANADIASKGYVDAKVGKNADSITALETTVGDDTKGLVKDVADLQDTVSNATDGLVKKVAQLENDIDGLSGDTGSISTQINVALDATLGEGWPEDTTVQAELDGKQDRSTADYQLGNKDGGWTELTPAQQGALNSGITSEAVAKIGTTESTVTALGNTVGDGTSGLVKKVNDIEAKQTADFTTLSDGFGAILGGGYTMENTVAKAIGAKQDQSTKDYQLGNKDGGWTELTDDEQAALKSGIKAADVAQIDTNKTNIEALQEVVGDKDKGLANATLNLNTSVVNLEKQLGTGFNETNTVKAALDAKQDKLQAASITGNDAAGNVISGITANNGTITVTKASVFPAVPSTAKGTDGTLVLTAKVVDGNVTYAWEDITRESVAQQ